MNDSSPPREIGATLIFYTRSGCHLCEVAKDQIDRLQERLAFRVEVRDVDDDRNWTDRYGDEVPVGVIDGRKVFKYAVDSDRLERALRAPGQGNA